MNHESLVGKYLGITNYHTEKIPLPSPIHSPSLGRCGFYSVIGLCCLFLSVYDLRGGENKK